MVEDGPEPCGAAHAASWNAETAQARRRVERRPESDEESEGKCEENAVALLDSGPLVDPLPVVEHPVPLCRRVEPMQRLSSGGAGLREPRVAFERIRQIRSVGRAGTLVLDQLLLSRKRHLCEEFVQAGNVRLNAGIPKFGRVEGIA